MGALLLAVVAAFRASRARRRRRGSRRRRRPPRARARRRCPGGPPRSPRLRPATPAPKPTRDEMPTAAPPATPTRGAEPAEADGGPTQGTPGTQAAGPVINIPQTEAEKAEGQPILRIDISGNRRVAKDDIVSYLREKPGNGFKIDNLASDVRELWDSGFFDDVEVDLTRERSRRHPALPRARAAEHQGDRVRRQQRDRERQAPRRRIEVKANTILSVPAVRRSVQKISDKYAEKGYFLAEVDEHGRAAARQRGDRQVQDHRARAGHRPPHHVHRQPQRPRRRAARGHEDRPGLELLRFGSGGPYRQDAFERDVLVISALYYDQGYLNVQIGTPRVMLTPDREGIEITLIIHEGPRFKIRQLRVYERDADGKEIEPIGGRRAPPPDGAREERRLLQPRRAREGSPGGPHAVPRRGLRQRGGRAGDRARSREARGRHHRPDPPRTARPRRAHRDPGQHEDPRQGHPSRDGDRGGRALQRDEARGLQAPHHALGYFERVDVSTEQGSTPSTININVEVTERPDRHVPGRRRLLQHRELHRDGADPAGEPVRQRPVARAAGADLRPPPAHRPPLLRAVLPRHATGLRGVELYDQLRVFKTSRADSLGGALTFGYPLIQPELRVGAHVHGRARRRSRPQTTSTLLRSTRGLVERLPAPAAREPVQRRRHVALRPAITYDTRNNRLFPTSGIFLQALDRARVDVRSAASIEFLRYRLIGALLLPAPAASSRLGSCSS